MGADSLPRRLLKKVLAPVLSDRSYKIIQGVSKAWDIRSGGWSEPELDLIPLAIRRGETAIDIGANFGLYSYYLSRAVGESGKVFAFEPVPFTAATFELVARLLRFRSVELVAKGCGDRAGELTFTVPIQDSGAIITGLVHMGQRNDDRDGRARHARFEKTKEIRCEVVVLDDYLGELRDVSFIKCDIEGADLFAMRGATKIIERHHPTIVCEINPWFVEGFGLTVGELVGFFTQRGYQLYRYQQKQLRPTPVDQVEEDNWIFVHPDRRDRLASLLAS
jgi:FkbM family methyltransferase